MRTSGPSLHPKERVQGPLARAGALFQCLERGGDGRDPLQILGRHRVDLAAGRRAEWPGDDAVLSWAASRMRSGTKRDRPARTNPSDGDAVLGLETHAGERPCAVSRKRDQRPAGAGSRRSTGRRRHRRGADDRLGSHNGWSGGMARRTSSSMSGRMMKGSRSSLRRRRCS